MLKSPCSSTVSLLIECITAGFIDEALFALELLRQEKVAQLEQELELIRGLLKDPLVPTTFKSAFLPTFNDFLFASCRKPLEPQRPAPLPPVRGNKSDREILLEQCTSSSSFDITSLIPEFN